MSDGKRRGGEVLTGDREMGERGYFYRPTLLTRVSTEMEVWRQETFGPVLSVKGFDSEEEAVQLSNDVS